MFQTSQLTNRNSIPQDLSISSLKDQILSLTHRLNTIQHSLTSKMDRQQCLTLMQRKTNNSYLKKVIEQIKMSFSEEKKKEQQNFKAVQDQHTNSIKNLMQKLNQVKFTKDIEKTLKGINNKNRPITIKPQELYLQSNETMFSMLIQELNNLRNSQNSFEKTLEQKHKSTINLNNEVCRKIDRLQNQIQSIARGVQNKVLKTSQSKHLNTQHSQPYIKNNWNVSDIQQTMSPFIKKSSPSKYQQSMFINNEFETIKIDNLTKNLENVQREMVNKVNLKDVIPIIKKNSVPFQEQLTSMKNFMQENLQSMRKILLHQSQINQQLCGAIKVGWWQSMIMGSNYEQQVVWDKQLINMYPDGFISKKSNKYIQVLNQGTYLIEAYFNLYYGEDEQSKQFFLLINDQKIQYTGKRVIRLEKNSRVGLLSPASENYLCIHKL